MTCENKKIICYMHFLWYFGIVIKGIKGFEMELNYLIVYLEILTLCWIFTAVIFLSVRPDFGSVWEVRIFKCLLVTVLIALIADGFTHAHYRHFIHLPIPLLSFLYGLYMFMMSGLLSYFWLLFAEMKLNVSIADNRKYFILATIPVILIGIAAFSSIKTGWLFQIDENAVYHRGPFWVHQNIVAYGFFLITTVHALIKAKNEKSPQQRKEYYIISMFLISPFFGALLQLFIGSHPFVAPATVLGMFFIFINLQANAINRDTLTSLNNRKSTNEYIEENLTKATKENAYYVFMIDIDGFKLVNDTYGHLEGDKALVLFANVLRKNVDEYHGFVARYGGDEFLVVIEKKYLEDPDKFMEDVNDALAVEKEKQGLLYSLHGSYGYKICDGSSKRLESVIDDADAMLYKVKMARKA